MIMLLRPQLVYTDEIPYIQLREEDCLVVFLLQATMYPMYLCTCVVACEKLFEVTIYQQESNTCELSCTGYKCVTVVF